MTEQATSVELGEFVRGYIECALWSSTDQSDDTGGQPLDDNYGPDDIDGASKLHMVAECREFVNSNLADLRAYAEELSWDYAGHDFWLTRNRHGAGFWDRGLNDLGTRLTDAAHPYGTQDLYVDGEEVHVA